MGQRPGMEKNKSIQEILSKGNNNLNRGTVAGRRDLEGHPEKSNIMILVRKLDTTLQSSKTVRFHADPSAVSQASWGQKWNGLRAEPVDLSYSTAFGMRLCSAVFQLTASGPRKEWNYGNGGSAAMQMTVSGCRQTVGKEGGENKTLQNPKTTAELLFIL